MTEFTSAVPPELSEQQRLVREAGYFGDPPVEDIPPFDDSNLPIQFRSPSVPAGIRQIDALFDDQGVILKDTTAGSDFMPRYVLYLPDPHRPDTLDKRYMVGRARREVSSTILSAPADSFVLRAMTAKLSRGYGKATHSYLTESVRLWLKHQFTMWGRPLIHATASRAFANPHFLITASDVHDRDNS